MPLAFLAALASSVMIHAAALFLPEVDLSPAPEPLTINAELVPKERPLPAPQKRNEKPRASKPPVVAQPPGSGPAQTDAPVVAAEAAAPAVAPPSDRLPVKGRVRFAVYKGTQGLVVGQALHQWEMGEGRYRLTTLTETTGLAAVFKSIRVEQESQGRLTAEGLQPEHLLTRRNGSDTGENADFDWAAGQVRWGREGATRDLQAGAQDLASFPYQLGYVPGLRSGLAMGVATGRKYEVYRFEVVGEETLETPAGTYQTLHIRVPGDSVTELWLAQEQLLVPVKIRHTDRKGDVFEQVAVELILGN